MLIDIVARVTLLPVLIGQALWTRAHARMLPEPAGARSGMIGQGPVLRLLVIGDSSAAGVGVDHQTDALLGQISQKLAQHNTVHFDLVAQTGARTQDVLSWLPDLPSARYDVVVTALGVNDVTKGTTLRGFIAQQRQLIAHMREHRQARLVIVSGLPPVGQFPLLPNPLRWVLGRQATRFNRELAVLVRGLKGVQTLAFKMPFDPTVMSGDGFHPSPSVYDHWAELAVAMIRDAQAQLDAADPTP